MSATPLIAVAMSGGVDSSTVAALLARDGHNIVGMTMQLWNQRRLGEPAANAPVGRCCSLDDVYDARMVARTLGVAHYVVNLEAEFERTVVAPFVDEYIAGRTPIPCTLCNNHVKFDRFLDLAEEIGAERVATGHYARITFDEVTARWQLRAGVDGSKDQTYFLWGLKQHQLARTLFPLGEMHKSDVRALAASLNVPTATKHDSQEICFVPDGNYARFIEAYFREQGRDWTEPRGVIVDTAGHEFAEHSGVHHFTIGQRKGLGFAAGEPLYVIRTDATTQRVTVGREDDLRRNTLRVRDVNWLSIAPITASREAHVKIRNKHAAAAATLRPTDNDTVIDIEFNEPQRAITPGQAAVFYSDDIVLGGGWIE